MFATLNVIKLSWIGSLLGPRTIVRANFKNKIYGRIGISLRGCITNSSWLLFNFASLAYAFPSIVCEASGSSCARNQWCIRRFMCPLGYRVPVLDSLHVRSIADIFFAYGSLGAHSPLSRTHCSPEAHVNLLIGRIPLVTVGSTKSHPTIREYSSPHTGSGLIRGGLSHPPGFIPGCGH